MARKKSVRRVGGAREGPVEGRRAAAGDCSLAAEGVEEIPIGPPRLLGRLAMKWSYSVRNRHRWAGSETELARLSEAAIADLAELGLDGERLAALARRPVAQVTVPYADEQSSWAGRIFPWEFVLSRATRALAERHPEFLVVRRLKAETTTERAAARPAPVRTRELLFVSSSPGLFRDEFEFEDEKELLQSALGDRPGRFRELANPTASGLESAVRGAAAVHVSAIDAHLGMEILARHDETTEKDGGAEPARRRALRDGIYLSGERGGEELVDAERLARLLAGKRAPALVTLNVYGSAARMASLLAAGGVGAAIGFLDRVDDAQAEQFFTVFYRHWAAGHPVPASFREAFRAMRELATLRLGSGVVLWSPEDLLAVAAAPRPSTALRARAEEGPTDGLKLRVTLPKSLNYPKLHNGERLFERLRIYNLRSSAAKDVRVEVTLQVGAESYAYSRQLALTRPLTALEDDVSLALSWSLARGLTESVRTTIHVRATSAGQVFHEETYPIALLPVNEWMDDDESGPWLPSLVLPRDPAVAEIVGCARRYLRVLADDAHVGFDGYQQVAAPPDGEPVDEEGAWVVDAQVKAIWYALLHDYGLGYINPPPTFTDESQRLRRPSEVVDSRHGTCIDLALLLAACLEYVGINPVLFLIEGHAFPGYWRFERTAETIVDEVAAETTGEEPAGVPVRTRPWSTGPQYWRELRYNLQLGKLVPIETVDLTALESFDQARENGLENLKNRAEFHTMLDVTLARSHGVTPLPL